MDSLHVKELVLENFRNYHHLELTLSHALTLLTGGNAQGKTNILEAIYWMASGRSHRTLEDADLVRGGQEGCRVGAVVDIAGRQRALEIAFHQLHGRRFTVGTKVYRRVDGAYSGLYAVLFAPEDLDLIKGSPATRRRFLDEEVFQGSPVYRKTLAGYGRCLAQRNRLLKDAGGRGLSAGLLDPWNRQLAESGAAVTRMRRQIIGSLAPGAARVQEQLTGGAERLQLGYRPSGADDCGEFVRLLEEKAREELARGVTLVGPHRDELAVELGGKPLRTHGSQGQQRCAVLALKAAVAEHLRLCLGSAPVLLLDDILSELDERRQRELLNLLGNASQTIITSAARSWSHRDGADPLVYEVEAGSARRVLWACTG